MKLFLPFIGCSLDVEALRLPKGIVLALLADLFVFGTVGGMRTFEGFLLRSNLPST